MEGGICIRTNRGDAPCSTAMRVKSDWLNDPFGGQTSGKSVLKVTFYAYFFKCHLLLLCETPCIALTMMHSSLTPFVSMQMNQPIC